MSLFPYKKVTDVWNSEVDTGKPMEKAEVIQRMFYFTGEKRLYRPVILANIWVKPTTNCYRNEKCIFEIYNPICVSEKKSSNVAYWEI